MTTEKVPKASVSPGEALVAGYPGSAVLVRPDCSLIAANEKGAGIGALLDQGGAPELMALVNLADTGGTVATGSLSLPGTIGKLFLEVTVVPMEGMDGFLILGRDQTLDQNLRTALVESRQRFKDLVEVSSDFAWEVGFEGTFTFVSPRGALGHGAEDLIGRRPQDFVIDPEEYSPLPFVSEKPLEAVDMWMRAADGSTACIVASCIPLFSGEGEWQGARGVCRNVTAERERENELDRVGNRDQLLNYIVGTIRDEVQPRDMLSAAATATARALGATGCRIYRWTEGEEPIVAMEYGDVDVAGGLESCLDRLGGTRTTVEERAGDSCFLAVATRYQQAVNGAICLCKAAGLGGWSEDDHDLLGRVAGQLGIANEQILNHERIVELSRTDGLTGLLNRRAFLEDELPRRIRRLGHGEGTATLFYLDLDNFKRVNDVHGHQRGDQVLILLKDMLIEYSRAGDAVARIGGDEFAMWLDRIEPEVADRRARALVEASRELEQFSGDPEAPLGISIGVAVYDPRFGEGQKELLARADTAMYAVKKGGKGGYRVAPPPSPAAEPA